MRGRYLVRPQQTDARGKSAFTLGVRVGYWPCRNGPFVSFSMGFFTLDLWVEPSPISDTKGASDEK